MSSLEPIPEIVIIQDGAYTLRGVRLYGTLYRYLVACERELWFQVHSISPDPDNELLLLGKLIHEEFYGRYTKEVFLHGSVIDVLLEDGGELLVMEVKRRQSVVDSYVLQMAFYLYLLRWRGMNTRGMLSFPLERRRIAVEWRDELRRALREATLRIDEVAALPKPPAPNRKPYCKVCAYKELCY